MPNDAVPAGQRISGRQWVSVLMRRWSRVRDQRATNGIRLPGPRESATLVRFRVEAAP